MERLVRGVRALPEGRPPWAPGAVVLAGRGPVVAAEAAAGWALRFRAYDPGLDRGLDLPRDLWEPMRVGTVFDLASLSKLFTAIAAVQQMERGRLALDDEVRADLPAFARGITVRQLLTHTSGLAPSCRSTTTGTAATNWRSCGRRRRPRPAGPAPGTSTPTSTSSPSS